MTTHWVKAVYTDAETQNFNNGIAAKSEAINGNFKEGDVIYVQNPLGGHVVWTVKGDIISFKLFQPPKK